MPKKISVNFSTLVDLKAELSRKQEQVNRQKLAQPKDESASSSYVKGGKPILYEARKAAAAQQKQQKGAESAEKRRRLERLEAAVKEEERQLSRSRQRLEEKAALYEKLKSGRDDGTDDSSGLYLVNFERKAFEERRKSDDSDQESDHDVPSASSHADDGDWVEYTDVLGRTRKCLRQDLPNFVAADEKLKERRRDDQDGRLPSTSLPSASEKSELLSEDMRRELKRKAWEREEEEAAAAAAHRGPLHYQHVAQEEARQLGVGYFAFAPDEQTRQEQLKMLDDLRQQTMSQRERSQKVKEKRQAALKARLEKVKARKNLNLEGDAVSNLLNDADEEDPAAALDDIPLPPSTSAAELDEGEIGPMPPPAPAKKQVRPWDVGKPKVPREDWTEKRRKDRPQEFAPPSFY